MDEMLDTPFRNAVEEKFVVDLTGRPTMYTVHDSSGQETGRYSADSKTKIITVLLYMNSDSWGSSAGRLRLLRNGSDLENYAVEIEPVGGTLLIFRRSDKSWHGHHPYKGKRRAIQLNWVTDQSVVDHEQGRHGSRRRSSGCFSRHCRGGGENEFRLPIGVRSGTVCALEKRRCLRRANQQTPRLRRGRLDRSHLEVRRRDATKLPV